MNADSKKILICSSEEGVRESLKLILGDRYNLILTDSAEQCLEFLHNGKSIRLALIDIGMIQDNDLNIMDIVKEKRPDIDVIAIADQRSAEKIPESGTPGALECIIRPFKSDEILGLVEENDG